MYNLKHKEYTNWTWQPQVHSTQTNSGRLGPCPSILALLLFRAWFVLISVYFVGVSVPVRLCHKDTSLTLLFILGRITTEDARLSFLKSSWNLELNHRTAGWIKLLDWSNERYLGPWLDDAKCQPWTVFCHGNFAAVNTNEITYLHHILQAVQSLQKLTLSWSTLASLGHYYLFGSSASASIHFV
jgi:hypothetical protein